MPDLTEEAALGQEIQAIMTEIIRVNREESPDSIETAALLCGLNCKLFSQKTMLALLQNNEDRAYLMQREHQKWEKERRGAEAQRAQKLIPDIIERLDRMDQAGDAMSDLSGDMPEFDPANE